MLAAAVALKVAVVAPAATVTDAGAEKAERCPGPRHAGAACGSGLGESHRAGTDGVFSESVGVTSRAEIVLGPRADGEAVCELPPRVAVKVAA